ncbi:MAG: carbohydrate ABC transporter permease [Treponemataceae bacterium]
MNKLITGVSRTLLFAIAAAFAVPFVWMCLTSLKPADEIFLMPPSAFGSRLEWKNYIDAWNFLPFGRFLFNSFFVAACVTVLAVFTSSLAAYAFARIKFKGRDGFFVMYLATLMIPQQVTVIPLYLLMNKFGWGNSYLPLILPVAFTAFGTFLLRQFFLTIPYEMEESGRIDGCNAFHLYSLIIMPMAKPALASLAIFTFIGQWKSFLWPLIIVNKDSFKTMPLGLQMFIGQYGTEWNVLMAAASIAIIPSILIFVFFQRYLVEGISLTGMGGR